MLATPQDIYTKFQQLYAPRKVKVIDPFTGSINPHASRYLWQNAGATRNNDQYYTATITGTSQKGMLTGQEISGLFSRMAPLLFAGNNHLLAKSSPAWQQLYHYLGRQFSVMDNTGAVAPVNLPSYPCHFCGLILPEAAIQVDHRQPKAGGEGIAVGKVLHALSFGIVTGLTKHAASGAKGIQAGAIVSGPANALNPIAVKGWARATPWLSHNASVPKVQKYTLDAYGETFLTVAEVVFGGHAVVKACVNSILNLVPACADCNRSKKAIQFAHK